MFDKVASQPIEQQRMRRRLPLAAEIFRRANQPGAETHLPQPVDRHAGRQRMIVGGEPAGQPQPIIRLAGGKRRQHGGCAGGDSLGRHVVSAPREQKRLSRLGHFSHDHDLADAVDRAAALFANLAHGGELRFVLGVEVRQIKRQQRLARFGGQLINRRGERFSKRSAVVNLRHFNRRELPVEHLKLINQPVRKPPIAKPLADRDVVTASAADVFVEIVADHLALGRLAVDENPQPVGPARPVVSHRHMQPLPDRNLLAGLHANGVTGPEVNQRGAQPAVFDQQLIAAAAGVGPGPRAVKDDGPLFFIGRVHPQGNREGVVAPEIPQPDADRVVAAEFDGFANAAGHAFIGAALEFLEVLKRHAARHIGSLGPAGEPRLEGLLPLAGLIRKRLFGLGDAFFDVGDAPLGGRVGH